LGIGLFSLLVDYNIVKLSVSGLFIGAWHYFLIGVLTSNVIRRLKHSVSYLICWLIIEILFFTLVDIKPYAFAAVSSSLFIYYLWRNNLLDSIFTGKAFQFFGKISYTLYLVHPDIGWKTISVCKHIIDGPISPLLGGIIFIFALMLSVLAAYVLHILVEKPSLRLCNALRNNSLFELIKSITRKKSNI